MIVLNGEWSTFERGILENIVDVGARDLRFENIHFACDSITDAGGRVFAREQTCRVESMHGYTDPFASTRYSVELSCHTLEDWPDSEPPEYCPWCGARVVEEVDADGQG